MRVVEVFVAVVVSSGCIHSLPATPREHCAQNEMLLEGVSFSESSGGGVATDGSVVVRIKTSESESGIACRRPRNADEECEISAALASMQIKQGFDTKRRNRMQALGYVVLLIPGMVLHVLYNRERDDADRKATEEFDQVLASCQAEAEERQRPSPRREQRREVPIEPPAVVVRPRGFFCASSASTATAGLCTRIKSDCIRTRSIALGVVPDLGECALVEVSFCFGTGPGNEEQQCAPSADSCTAQRDTFRTSTTTPNLVSDCVEKF